MMKVNIESENDMQELGIKLAQKLPSGSVVELIGDVGAGKTTLVKGIGKGLGITETIQSPSYTIFCRYDADEKSLHHYDFYRLQDPGLVSYDLEESINTNGATTVIEWSDHVKDVLPVERVTVTIISTSEDNREVDLQGVEL